MHIKLLSVASLAILTGCANLGGGGGDSEPRAKATKSFVAASNGTTVAASGVSCLRSSAFDGSEGSCPGAAQEVVAEKTAPVAVAPPAPAPVAQVEKVVLSGRALFPYDSAQLTGQGDSEMSTLIEKLRTYSDIELIDVVGHADSRGATAYNQGLSERRAETVKSTLAGAFPQVPITASGLGETAPIASNDTAEGRRLNRRVEIRVEALN